MKKLLAILLTAISFQYTSAQMDDKFYYPSKQWVAFDLPFEEQNFVVDKDTINSVILSPKESAKATVLYFHGAGGNVSNYVKFVRPLVANGFQVVMVDFRGYGKSTGKPTHVNIASDAQVIFDKLLNDARYKGQKLIVYGASMGTQAAANLAKNKSSHIAALVLDGGISSFTDIALSKAPEQQHEMIKQYLVSPYSAKEDVKSLNGMPVLLIHSREDADVPFSHYETIVANIPSAKSSWIYKGDHLMAPVLFEEEFIKRMNELLMAANARKN